MIKLRQFSEAEGWKLLRELRNHPETVASLGANFRFISNDAINQLCQKWALLDSTVERCIIWDTEAEYHKELGLTIGFVSLTSIDFLNQSAEFSIELIPAAQGKGHGLAATKAMLEHGFNDLNLHRIYLKVLEDNKSAIGCYLKAGFTVEGCLKDSIFKQGKFKNQVIMSILAEDFHA